MNPFTSLKNLSPFHFTFHFFSLFLLALHFTSLCYTYLQITSHHFSSLFTFYRLHFPSLVFTFLTLVLKICVLLWYVFIALSSSYRSFKFLSPLQGPIAPSSPYRPFKFLSPLQVPIAPSSSYRPFKALSPLQVPMAPSRPYRPFSPYRITHTVGKQWASLPRPVQVP